MNGQLPPDPPGSRAIEKRLVVPCGVAELERSFTTAEGLAAFFAPDAFVEARVGGLFEVALDRDEDARGDDAGLAPTTTGSLVRAYVPGQSLTLTWSLPPSFRLLHAQKRRTELTLRFEPDAEEGARLTLLHRGFRVDDEQRAQREWDEAHRYFTHLWAVVLSRLVRRWKSGPIDWSQA